MSYDPRKAAQVIAYLILRSGGRSLNVLKAVKLVYLTDRESVRRFGFPVLDERRCSMPHGPVNSTTYSFINGEYNVEGTGWADFLRDKENHNLAIADASISDQDLDELSDADIACMDTVWEQFGHMNQWELRDWTHDPRNVPEWEEPNGGSIEIPLQRMLSALGVADAEHFANLSKQQKYIDQAFEKARA
ncbi:MAG: DUF4065 domain-containing protein [Verrucomicrobiaceae bacterium]|nr:MAG: DUF4065 domain-containing protein [Verrucomicrobiaceae bacterium]